MREEERGRDHAQDTEILQAEEPAGAQKKGLPSGEARAPPPTRHMNGEAFHREENHIVKFQRESRA